MKEFEELTFPYKYTDVYKILENIIKCVKFRKDSPDPIPFLKDLHSILDEVLNLNFNPVEDYDHHLLKSFEISLGIYISPIIGLKPDLVPLFDRLKKMERLSEIKKITLPPFNFDLHDKNLEEWKNNKPYYRSLVRYQNQQDRFLKEFVFCLNFMIKLYRINNRYFVSRCKAFLQDMSENVF